MTSARDSRKLCAWDSADMESRNDSSMDDLDAESESPPVPKAARCNLRLNFSGFGTGNDKRFSGAPCHDPTPVPAISIECWQ